jgi:hypothetical protein
MNQIKVVLLGFLGAALFHLIENYAVSKAFAASDQGAVLARELSIIDANGKVRIQVGLGKDGQPGIWFFDEAQKVRLNAGLYPDGTAFVGLQDKDQRMTQLMRSFGPGESPLLIFKNKGQDSLILGLNPKDQTPFTMYYDKSGKRNFSFGTYDGP